MVDLHNLDHLQEEKPWEKSEVAPLLLAEENLVGFSRSIDRNFQCVQTQQKKTNETLEDLFLIII